MNTDQKLSPGILSVLPIFYVAWADGILSPTEVKTIHKKLSSFKFLDASEIAYLKQWTNPANAPSEEIFGQWVHQIKEHARDLPQKAKRGLATLGLEMALSLSSDENRKTWLSAKTRDSIEQLEIDLGVQSPDSRSILLSRFRTDKEILSSDVELDWSISELHKYLEGDQKEIKDKLRALLSDPSFTKKHIGDKEAYRTHILKQLKVLADQGYGKLPFPKATGGDEAMLDYLSVFELLAHYDGSLSVKYGVQFGLFGLSIMNLGSSDQHLRYLEATGDLSLLGCFAMTETEHGSNVRGLQTTATFDVKRDGFIIHTPHRGAGKEYIGNALHGQKAVVFAQLIVNGVNHGVHALVTPLTDAEGKDLPSIKREDCGDKMGLNGVDNGRLYFDNVLVPRDDLLDKFGYVDEEGNYSSPIENPSKRFFMMLGTLVGGRIGVAKAGLSSAKNALCIAIRYANKRRQFGPNEKEAETLLLDYPSHQHRLIPRLAKAYGLHFALEQLVEKYTLAGKSDKKIETLAAGLKASATWFATSTIQECREACGGAGYIWENGLSQIKADSDIFTTFEGDNTVLMQLVAKGLLSEFKKSFHDEGFRAVFRYIYKKVDTRLTEKNIIQKRKTDSAHLLDPAFHREAFRFREKHLLHTVGQRMKKYIGKRLTPYDAFLRCQNHLIALSEAYIDRVILKAYHQAISAASPDLQNVLKLSAEVYALDVIQKERAYFLEHGYMEAPKTKAIRRILNQRIRLLRPQAEALTDAWNIPQSCLHSVIAQAD